MSNEIQNPNRVLNKEGLSYLWTKIKSALSGKADKSELNNYAALNSSPEFTGQNISIKNNNVDLTELDNDISETAYSGIFMKDKNEDYANFSTLVYPDGNVQAMWGISNYNTSDNDYTGMGGMAVTVDKTGDISWLVTGEDSFRDAIDAKELQEAVNDPTASGTSTTFIDSISQNENGVITPTKKTVDFSGYAALNSSPVFTGTNVFIKNNTADITKANNNVSADAYNNYILTDKNENSYALFEGGTLANGKTLSGFFVKNYKTADSEFTGWRGMYCALDKSNTLTWSVADPSAFRTAISAKGTQSAVSDPTASGTSATFIDSISQNAQGVITATKKTVRTFTKSGSSAASGLVPAPSTTAGTTKFLCEDATWKTALTSHQDISGKKNVQTAVSSPSASGSTNAFIDTISQNTQGVITVTKKYFRDASESQSGVVSTGTQSFAGTKRFTGNFVLANSATSPYCSFRGSGLDTSNAFIYAVGAETSDGKYGNPYLQFYQYSPASGGASRTDYADRYRFPDVATGKTANNTYNILAAFKNAPSFTSFTISNGSNKTFTIPNSYRGIFYLIGTNSFAQEIVMVYSTTGGVIAYTEYASDNTAGIASPFIFTKETNSFKITNNSGYTVYVHIMSFNGGTPS